MSASKRPSTSSLRRFISSRPYVTVAELRRRFGLDDPDAMTHVQRNGTSAWIGLPEREAAKLQDLWLRDELGLELSVEVRAPVVVGIYPMRIARYVMENITPAALAATAANGPPADSAQAASIPSPSGQNGRVPRPMGFQRPHRFDDTDWKRRHEPPQPSTRPPGQ
jgi:hypothetical protein